MNCEFICEEYANLVMKIADSGIGIRQEDLGSIFDEFTQVAQNGFVESSGLGLAITNSFVKAMGGCISVQSEYGLGSTFIITLPQKYKSRENPMLAPNANDESNTVIDFTSPEAKVLVVDDVSTNLVVARGLLHPYKMRVVLCNSGIEAIEEIRSKDYDMVLMDHVMPEMDGVEVTRRIREMGALDPYYRKLAVIALTANAVSGTKEMFLENGFNDFLAKPIELAELNKVIKKWIPKSKHVRHMVTHIEK